MESQRKLSNDPVRPAQCSSNDLDYFEQLIHKFSEDLSVPLLTRRQRSMRDDPVEEIHDLVNELKESERNFKKVLEISCKTKEFLGLL